MQTSFCERGHEVWWGWLDGEDLPFVRFTHGYDLRTDDDDSSPEPVARALRYCYRLHSDVCDSDRFTPRLNAYSPRRTYHYEEEQ